MNDLEKLLAASITIERFKKELALSADAIRCLRETIDLRDQEIARLRPFKRDLTQPWDASQR